MKRSIQPSISLIYNRRNTATPTKKASIEMRILYKYKQKYISTGIMLYPHQWKNGNIINCPDIIQLSKILTKLVADTRQILIEMMQNGNIDLDDIPEKLKQMNSCKMPFLQFCSLRARIRKYGKAKDSQERYNRFLRLFAEYGKIKSFEDITESSIIEYDLFLTARGMNSYSKWNNYHRFLNSFVIDAIDAGYIKKNPYKWINIARNSDSTCTGRYLTPEEFNKIKNAELPTKSLERTRDMFIFQTYTCLSYVDLKTFNYENIQDIKGMKVYIGKRNKTKVAFTIPLLQPALDILYKYNNVLPVISNERYNDYLKLVALAAKVDKPISSHWARHTGATMLLNEGVDMKIVSKICGHSSTKVTERVYAKLLDETIIEAVSKVHI